MAAPAINTLGQLKATGYQTKTIRQELRANLILALQAGTNPFQGIFGYDDTVLPDVQRALLSGHHILLLGLRGQAKTRIARQLVNLLDEYIPVVAGSELNDDPLHPISRFAIDLIAEKGDDTPITWWHRDDRYTEKLATPDVTVADLIGDVDPIKAANLKLSYSDERVIHFGLIPRSHRGLFVINELPDLQPRIQVSLFNILQEGDIQIRGFKVRMPLDIQFVFTANPEDYTNRGNIVTPLKDRIDSQIITHYPDSIELGRKITWQEARITAEQRERVALNDIALNLIERIAIEARKSEYVDAKSGVSARMTISALENLYSAAERRSLLAGERLTMVRLGDFWGLIPSITGKIELVYEGEQEGAAVVAHNLISKAIREEFVRLFPHPEKLKKSKQANPYKVVTDWFGDNELDLLNELNEAEYRARLSAVDGLDTLVDTYAKDLPTDLRYFTMEFVLHGLAEYSMLSKGLLAKGTKFKDLLSGMMGSNAADDEDDDVEGYGYYEDDDKK